MAYLPKHKKTQSIEESPKLPKIYNEKFLDLICQGTVERTFYENVIKVNPSNLVPKSNGDMRLVVDIRKVNQFTKPIKFKRRE
jgi:hypothetical protein